MSCNSETFVCEKCQCVHYDSVLALLVQMLGGHSTTTLTRRGRWVLDEMSTHVNRRYIGGSSNVNVDNKSFHIHRSELSNEVMNCLLTMILTILIKNGFR